MKTHILHQIVLIDPDNRELFTKNVVSETAGRYILSSMSDSELNFTTKVQLRKLLFGVKQETKKIILATLHNDANGYTVITENT
jgi:hypothetical protein